MNPASFDPIPPGVRALYRNLNQDRSGCFSIQEVAEYLKLEIEKVYELITTGQLEARKVCGEDRVLKGSAYTYHELRDRLG
jgi:excisionase family DNA binding protein